MVRNVAVRVLFEARMACSTTFFVKCGQQRQTGTVDFLKILSVRSECDLNMVAFMRCRKPPALSANLSKHMRQVSVAP